MTESRTGRSTRLVVPAILALACIMLFNSCFIQPARGETGGAISVANGFAIEESPADASSTMIDNQSASTPVTEQAGLNFWLFLLLLLIPLTGVVIYYYGIVKGK